jgi:hypothetical protein
MQTLNFLQICHMLDIHSKNLNICGKWWHSNYRQGNQFPSHERQNMSSGLLVEGGCLYKCLYFVFTDFVIREVKYLTFSSLPHEHFRNFHFMIFWII